LRIERCAVGGRGGIKRVGRDEVVDVVAVGCALEDFTDAAVAGAK
jgi:hypothetical protein